MKKIILVLSVTLPLLTIAYADDYLENYSSNLYAPNSTSNPYGAGSPYNPNSINNPHGVHGSPYSSCLWSTRSPRLPAAQKLNHEKPGQTLQATALVHEAYMRLVGWDGQGWDSRVGIPQTGWTTDVFDYKHYEY